jgi:hypothetical protein
LEFRNVPPGAEQTARVLLNACAADPQGKPVTAAASLPGDRLLQAARNIDLLRIPRATGTIRVDGVPGEEAHGTGTRLVLGRDEQLTGKRNDTGTDRTEATVTVRWDKDALTFGIRVTDDTVMNNAGLDTLWKGDCIEIYLDTAPDENMNDHRYHDHQGKFVVAPASRSHRKARITLTKTPDGQLRGIRADKAEAASRPTDSGYDMEIRIPVRGAPLVPGTVWGFNISLIDHDGAGRGTQWMWTGGRKSWRNPHAWGFVVMSP